MAQVLRNRTLRAALVALYALVAGLDQGLHYLAPAGSCHQHCDAEPCHDGCCQDSAFAGWRQSRGQVLTASSPRRAASPAWERGDSPPASHDCVICQSLRQLVGHASAGSQSLDSCSASSPALLGCPAQAERLSLGTPAARGPPAVVV
ncbi:hypothetical protein [Posidoniimonas polymericola]|uniref:hypothetical protein n=1 Tax=Posidoniimonas polymericola TaxID=2528002 RepID=UPI0011B6A3C2|nr:hypothetical protein [Posidoniimonas polymericola]